MVIIRARTEISYREDKLLGREHFLAGNLDPDTIWHSIKRKILPKGGFIALGDEEEEDIYWAEIYDGRFGHVFFGHQPFMHDRPVEFPHATALDLGCVHGGKLLAVILEESSRKFVTVDAHRSYAGKINAMGDMRYPTVPIPGVDDE